MKVYVFTGDRAEIMGREPLHHGDRLELEDADAEYLLIHQGVPLVPLEKFEGRATPAEDK